MIPAISNTIDLTAPKSPKGDLINIFASGKFVSIFINMSTSMFYGATKETFRFAHFLRNNLTPAEKKLWSHLQKNALGSRFRCQHPAWKYVLDFYCQPYQLAVEVDGSYHLLDEIFEFDKKRQLNLMSFGISIIRFSNDQVYEEIDLVVSCIEEKLSSLKQLKSILPHTNDEISIKSPLGDLGAVESSGI